MSTNELRNVSCDVVSPRACAVLVFRLFAGAAASSNAGDADLLLGCWMLTRGWGGCGEPVDKEFGGRSHAERRGRRDDGSLAERGNDGVHLIDRLAVLDRVDEVVELGEAEGEELLRVMDEDNDGGEDRVGAAARDGLDAVEEQYSLAEPVVVGGARLVVRGRKRDQLRDEEGVLAHDGQV